MRPQLAKQRHTDRLGRSPGTPFRPSSWEEAGFLTASPQVGARKRQTFPEAISNRRCQSRPQPRATHDPLPGAPPGAPPHLSARHLRSPVKGGHPASGTPPQARPRGLAGQAGRGQGWGSGNPLPAPGEGQSQGLEQTKLPWSWGPGHRGPESPSSAAGRRFTGNRKMCTSRCWNRRTELRRKAAGGGDAALRLPQHRGGGLPLLSGAQTPVCSGLDACSERTPPVGCSREPPHPPQQTCAQPGLRWPLHPAPARAGTGPSP